MTGTAVRHPYPYPDLALTVAERGQGRPALVLHGGVGPASMTVIVDHLAATRHVIAPPIPAGTRRRARPGSAASTTWSRPTWI